MKRIPVDIFIHANEIPIIDVRSPKEYADGHITGACNIPLFSDEERHKVGLTYKTMGRETAIGTGLQLVGPKIHALAEQAKALSSQPKRRVYCWRGGMRSEKMAWLFELLEMECLVLQDGYKAYRNKMLADFPEIKNLYILQGPTGSGKTEILDEMRKMGEQIIDLEGLANHRGSAFGHIGLGAQPTSQQFQNDVHDALLNCDINKRIWMEAESLKIGFATLPDTLWARFKDGIHFEISIDRQNRINRLVDEYGPLDVNEIAESIRRIGERLGNRDMHRALQFLNDGDLAACANTILDYYDNSYKFSQQRFHKNATQMVLSNSPLAVDNAKKIIEAANKFDRTPIPGPMNR